MKTGCAIVGAVVVILVLSGVAFFLLIWNAAGPVAAVGDAFVEQVADIEVNTQEVSVDPAPEAPDPAPAPTQ